MKPSIINEQGVINPRHATSPEYKCTCIVIANVMLYLFSLLLLIVADVASSQSLTWKTLSLPKANDRYNDVWFVDPMTGWAIIPSDGFKEDGMIYKTTDGGATWVMQFKSYKHLRSVCFLDPLVG
ncbi:MAG TPA: hypothetical protein VFH43_03080, partial [Candidatus Kapabacteria bacterium]|nr:hypothetical protein [Candidatus Kapabacteria bacterium]